MHRTGTLAGFQTANVFARAMALGLLGLQVMTSAAAPATAATLYVVDPYVRNDPSSLGFTPACNIKIDGTIQAGDYASIKSALEDFARLPVIGAVKKKNVDPAPGEEPEYLDFYPASNTGSEPRRMLAVCLSGPGGDIGEALRISHLFRNWIPVVEQDDECISACAILFMKAGARRDHVFYFRADDPGRFIHYSARLGFHAPKLGLPASPNGMIDEKAATDAYDRALATMRAVMFYAAALAPTPANGASFAGRWGSAVQLPPDLIMAFLATPSEEMFYVTRISEAMKWGIEIYGVPPPAHVTGRMLAVACHNVVTTRCSSLEPFERYEGECHQWTESEPTMDEAGAPFDEWHRTDVGQRQWLTRSFAGGHPAVKRRLWPLPASTTNATKSAPAAKSARGKSDVTSAPPGSSAIVIEAYELRETCQVKATWHQARLVDLELTTFNGITDRKTYDESLPTAAQVKEIEAALKAGTDSLGSDHLRPWKMLPATARLDRLSDKPWAWLDEGELAYATPVRW